MIRVVIMAQGQQTRLPDLKIPKQLLPLPLCNTTILDRTLTMLTSDDRVGEIVVIGCFARHLTDGGDGYFNLGRWAPCTSDDADATMSTTSRKRAGSPPVCLEVVKLNAPGNSVIRGLRAIRPYLRQEAVIAGGAGMADSELDFTRTVILLGDVVYSRRCLAALADKAPAKVWFAVSPDLSPGGGEVFGCSYDQDGTEEFLSILDNVVHPPFTDTYQPGQLRRLLWERQRRIYELEMSERTDTEVRAVVLEGARQRPSDKCCTIMNDFTTDIDTIADLRLLGDLDVRAWEDDHHHAPGYPVS
jgi:hypothetical protein